MKRQLIATSVLGLGLVLAASGCSQKLREYRRDAPVSGRDDSPAKYFNMPDGVSNFATKCDGPNMVYVAFHGDGSYAAIAVVPNDPRCKVTSG